MSLKSFKPTTPSNRYKVLPSFDEITKCKPEKSLLEPIRKSGGRNNNGPSPPATSAVATRSTTAW